MSCSVLIDLHQIDADTGQAGHQTLAFSESGPAAGHVWVMHTSNSTYIHASNDGDAIIDLSVALDGYHDIDASDFVL